MSSLKILVVPDKFKGTLSAREAAESIARGWKKIRPQDHLDLLPMSDGGDGFGEVLSNLIGATPQAIQTMDAAHRSLRAAWWWEAKTRTAVVESARIVGLAMLPPGKFHPFQLDTAGLAKVLEAAAQRGARKCFIGIGGSATNDGGFGLARALGWSFMGRNGDELAEWWQLSQLKKIVRPRTGAGFGAMKMTVAVDVQNLLLNSGGCSRVYGPQKGLRPEDMPVAEKALRRLAAVTKNLLKFDFARKPGAGAAGGLGFGLMAFAGAIPESGFEIFARLAALEKRIRSADLVMTGEGALDRQTLMGKGVGQIALRCRKLGVSCLGLAGIVTEPEKAGELFTRAQGLVEITSVENAKKFPARFLEKLSAQMARTDADHHAASP